MHYDIKPSPEVHIEIGILIASLQDSTREWLDELGTPTPEALVWQPFPGGHSIGGTILHIAATEVFWLQTVGQGGGADRSQPAVVYDDQLDQDNVDWPVPPSQPFEWYRDILELQRAESIAMIAAHNDPLRVYERPSGNSMTYRWILAHLVEHDAYHGGQAVLLHEQWKKSAR